MTEQTNGIGVVPPSARRQGAGRSRAKGWREGRRCETECLSKIGPGDSDRQSQRVTSNSDLEAESCAFVGSRDVITLGSAVLRRFRKLGREMHLSAGDRRHVIKLPIPQLTNADVRFLFALAPFHFLLLASLELTASFELLLSSFPCCHTAKDVRLAGA